MSTISPITTATNLNTPDTSVSENDARRFFNNFYSQPLNVGPAGDAILGFFEQYVSNQAAAKNLAAAVIYTATAQNLDPMIVLSEFQRVPRGQLTSYLAAFLNSNRSPTSLLGFRSTQTTNQYITRTILI
jgi:hypothetical protein